MSRHIFSFDKHPLNKDKSVMADNGKSYLRIYGEGVIGRTHFDMLGKEIYMPLMDDSNRGGCSITSNFKVSILHL